jgi:hypothetical protein
MAIRSIAVDQRVSNIESRRFASVEKALVELITNSDESYTRMERTAAMWPGAAGALHRIVNCLLPRVLQIVEFIINTGADRAAYMSMVEVLPGFGQATWFRTIWLATWWKGWASAPAFRF